MSVYLEAKPYHVAYVVPDLDRAVDRLLAAGIGPVHFIRDTPMTARYRGATVNIRVSAAFVVIAGLLTELVMQEGGDQSSFTDFIARHPSGALHHVAYWSDDFAETLKEAAGKGLKLVPHMEYLDPQGNSFEAYFEPAGSPDAVLRGRLEALERSMHILTFGGGTNEMQRDLIAIFGLNMPGSPR